MTSFTTYIVYLSSPIHDTCNVLCAHSLCALLPLPGDVVDVDDVIAVIETDKVTVS